MNPRAVRLVRVLLVFALTGWAAAVAVLASDADVTALGAWRSVPAQRGAVAAAIAGLVWAPLLGWARPRWPIAALGGLLAGGTTLLVFFFLWPHGYQGGRMRAGHAAALFLSVYWRILLPAAMAAGVVAARWAAREVPRPRWARLADDDLPPEPRA